MAKIFFKKTVLLTSSLLLVIMAIVASPRNAVAAPQVAPNDTVTVSPFLSEVQIKPDVLSQDVSFFLSNRTGKERVYNISTVDFGTLNETGGLAFSGATVESFARKHGLAEWLSLPAPQVSVPPNQTVTITAIVRNDGTLGPGGHYAALIMTLDNPGTTRESVMVEQKISALIFANKQGGEVYDMKLDSLTHDGNWSHMPNVYTLLFENTGNVAVVPRGTVRLKTPQKTEIALGAINEGSAYVLPETKRQIVVQTHAGNHAAMLPGRYTVQVDYRYDGHDTFATKTYHFTYWNVPGLITVFIMLASILFAVVIIWRRHKRLIARVIVRGVLALQRSFKRFSIKK